MPELSSDTLAKIAHAAELVAQADAFPPQQLHECHGSIHHLQCMEECSSGVWRADGFEPEIDEKNCRLLNAPPACPVCGGLARPNILMFGDLIWVNGRQTAQRRLEDAWLDQVASGQGNVVVIEMGAGTAVPSVRHFSHRMSKEFGARIIRINPRESQVPSTKDVGLSMGSLAALSAIDAEMHDVGC